MPAPSPSRPTTPRSAIPRVLGILLLVVGSLTALDAMASFALGELVSTHALVALVAAGIAALQVDAGRVLVRYRPNAVSATRFYALANLYVTVTLLLLLVVAGAHTTALYAFPGTLASLAWSAIVLAVVSRPAVAAACST